MNQYETGSEKGDAIRRLRRIVRPGGRVFVQEEPLQRVGNYRLRFYVPTRDGRRLTILSITYYVSQAIGRRMVRGALSCKEDAWEQVYCLGRALFPKGGPLALSPRKAQEERAGHTRETDGGYLLTLVRL